MPECPHVKLERKNTAGFRWYECDVCDQKFQAKEWDGKLEVVYPTGQILATGNAILADDTWFHDTTSQSQAKEGE
jgi:hypothetical protein